MDSLRTKDFDQPLWLNRSLRGFEALIDYLKTDRKFVPSEPDVKKLLEIELEYFNLGKLEHFDEFEDARSKLSKRQRKAELKEQERLDLAQEINLAHRRLDLKTRLQMMLDDVDCVPEACQDKFRYLRDHYQRITVDFMIENQEWINFDEKIYEYRIS